MKTAVITGANAGIGYETALQLAIQGFEVCIVGRSEPRCKEAVSNIQKQCPSAHISYAIADLSSQQSIKHVAIDIRNRFPILDVLINNAGQVFSKYETSVDGIEMQFATNHLAYFLLTNELLPSLLKSKQGRIINVSSNSHYHGSIHFDDLFFEKKYSFFKAYAQSKLCNVFFTFRLASLLQHTHITVNALHPGLVRTHIGEKNTKWWEALAWKLWSMKGISQAEGARTSVYLASAADLSQQSGKYWSKCKIKEPDAQLSDENISQKLWHISEQYCHVNFQERIHSLS